MERGIGAGGDDALAPRAQARNGDDVAVKLYDGGVAAGVELVAVAPPCVTPTALDRSGVEGLVVP